MKTNVFIVLVISLLTVSTGVAILAGCGNATGGGGGGTSSSHNGILYVANSNPGCIMVYDNPGTLNGTLEPTRVISGDATQLDGIDFNCLFVDIANNKLYVTSVNNNSILVFDNASTAHGNIAPSKTIESTALTHPCGIFVRGSKIYVANGLVDATDAKKILVFNTSDSGTATPETTISYEAMGAPVDLYVTSNNTSKWPSHLYRPHLTYILTGSMLSIMPIR
jgi:hypothetical protein